MARAFRATTRGYKAELEPHERRLLSQLCGDVVTMLTQRGENIAEAAGEPFGDSSREVLGETLTDQLDEASGAQPEGGSGDQEAESHGSLAQDQVAQDQAAQDKTQASDSAASDETTASDETAVSDETDPSHGSEDDDEPDEFAHFRRELAGLDIGLEDDVEREAPGLSAPEDQVLARLLPDASTDTTEAEQFRRLAEGSLRESKISDLQTARLLLESSPVNLTDDQAPIFGRALNDVRLTLATRLGIDDESDAQKIHDTAGSSPAANTEQFMAELYTFATWLQETLFTAMLEVLPEDE